MTAINTGLDPEKCALGNENGDLAPENDPAYLSLHARFNEDVLRMREVTAVRRANPPRPSFPQAAPAAPPMHVPVVAAVRGAGLFLLNNAKLDPQPLSAAQFLERNIDSESHGLAQRNAAGGLAPRRRRRGTAKLLKLSGQPSRV